MSKAKDMLRELAKHSELRDRRVLEAMGRVPRDEFVPAEVRHLAYTDRALPLSHQATISQPYVVAFMTTAAAVRPGDKVLEVGTGSGYQAAVLAEMGCRVHTIEFVPELAEQAADRLRRLGYSSIEVRQGDGAEGWPEAAPFAAIIVTAAGEQIPGALVEQLEVGGRLVIPLGTESQLLKVLVKTGEGLEAEAQVPVRFVRLRR